MGQKSSKDNTKNAQQQEQSTINHPKFKNASLSKDSDYLIITLAIENQTQFQSWQKNLNMLTELDDQTYLLPKAYQFEKTSVCGNSGKLKIQFDDFRFILHDQLQNRRNFSKHFEQEEIWYLLYSLVISAFHFNKMNRKVGDIRPKNIFINDAGQVKVSTIFSWPNQISNVDKTSHEKVVTYIAPQQMEQLNKGKVQTIINKHLAESFSIGLTILNTGLLDKMENLYNLQSLKFDNYLLEKKLNKWLKLTFESQEQGRVMQYSNPLKQVVLALCEPDPSDRITASQIYEWLSPYDQQIFNLQKFNASRPPIKKIRINYNQQIYNKVNPQIFRPQQPIYHNQHIKSSAITYQQGQIAPNGIIHSNSTNKNDQNVSTLSNQWRYIAQQPMVNNTSLVYDLQKTFVPFKSQPNEISGTNNRLINQKPKIIIGRDRQESIAVRSTSGTVAKYQSHHGIQNNMMNGFARKQDPAITNNFIIKQQQFPYISAKENHFRNTTPDYKTTQTRSTLSNGEDFLKKINQQLQKSKMMYP